jgi:hypothetical protein
MLSFMQTRATRGRWSWRADAHRHGHKTVPRLAILSVPSRAALISLIGNQFSVQTFIVFLPVSASVEHVVNDSRCGGRLFISSLLRDPNLSQLRDFADAAMAIVATVF